MSSSSATKPSAKWLPLQLLWGLSFCPQLLKGNVPTYPAVNRLLPCRCVTMCNSLTAQSKNPPDGTASPITSVSRDFVKVLNYKPSASD
ncbi:hypothetical protein GDO78_014492 [Eleutherodactylus coqui]|uniref:Secreted protein n=1 Tax=Eleutherodactylus coqui TaxID=57060 RepID=A0A8J6EEG1_ELECQ|nr:hypothetical protein GDO78_014492 [Eleutherodactylus coqui]